MTTADRHNAGHDPQAEAGAEQDTGRRYHHGDLRDALISESRRLIGEKGVEAFKIADACRSLGVSTAAPYRHFPDRDALLDAVCACAFGDLGAALAKARGAHPKGSVDGLVAMGRAYIDFVVRNPELFHMMWEPMREKDPDGEGMAAGYCCFNELIGAIEDVRHAQGLDHICNEDIALPLWGGVHGLAGLKMNNKLAMIENADPNRAIEIATRAIVEGFRKAASDKAASDDDGRDAP